MELKLPHRKLKFYHVLYVIAIVLCILSIYAAYSLQGTLWRPITNALICGITIIVVSYIDYRQLNRFASLGLVAAFILLIITLIAGSGGGGRSLELGSLSIQTFFIAAFLFVFYMATYLASHMQEDEHLERRDFVTIAIFFTIMVAMIALRNISTAVLLFGTGIVLLFIAGAKMSHILFYVAVMGICGYGYISIRPSHNQAASTEVETEEAHSDRGATGRNRITYWLTGKSDVQGYGSQMTRAKTAIARSAWPTGPGRGIIKESMPEKENDYVFAMLCEELSVGMGIIITLIYGIFFYQCTLIARKAKGNFTRLFAIGIGILVAGQAIIHIAVNVGLIPATGQTLPFISRGITNMLVTSVAFGILINMAKNVDKKADAQDEELRME